MSARQVSLLGPITLSVDGAEVALPGRRTRAVLAILALNAGRVVTVEQLLDSLWGEGVTAGATNTLQSYVSAIRTAAGDAACVLRRGPGYVLDVAPEDVDALKFEALVAEARRVGAGPHRVVEALQDALGLWHGPPLADVNGEPFSVGPVARLEEVRAEALERLFDAELALGRDAELVSRLEEVVAEHPLHERFAGQLALAQYRAGRQAESLSTISRVRHHLLEELGLSPGDDIVELERLILNQDPSLVPPSSTPPEREDLPRVAATSLTHPLVGRTAELDRLLQLWGDAEDGTSGVVVVAGEAGVGKTRLIAALAAHVHGRGRRVVWGRCSQASHLPYEPFVEAVGALGDPRRPATAFTDLLPSGVTDAELGLLALHEAVAGALSDALAAGGLLVVDDLHWADGKSTAMLAHVVAALAGRPVLTVIGRRTGTASPATDQVLGDLRRVGAVDRVDLRGLDREAVSQLVSVVRGADEALAEQLHVRTSGNPFFVHELLAAHDESAPPATVAEAVALRVGPADQPLGRLLGAAAVLDRDADLDLLAAVARLEEDDALAALDTALAGDLLRERREDGEELSFAHAIVRDAAYQSLTGARRRRLHRQAATAIAAHSRSGSPGPHQVEIARHLLAAGRTVDAGEVVEAAAAASEWCLSALAYDDAVRFAEQALADDEADVSDADDDGRSRSRARLRLLLAQALNATGDPDGARHHLRAVLATADRLDDGTLTAAAALGLSGGPGAGAGVRWGVVDQELVEALEAALAVTSQDDARTRSRLLAALAQALYNDPAAGARRDAVSAEAVAIAEQLDDDQLLGSALIARCIALWGPTGLAERLQLAQRAARLAADVGDDALAVTACIRVLPDAFEAGALDTVRSALATLEEKTARLRQPRFQWFAPLARSALALTLGDADRAQAEADAALAVVAEAQADGPALSHLVGTAMIARDRGELAGVETALRERAGGDPSNVTPRVLLAVLLAEDGRGTEALELLAGDLVDDMAALPRDYLLLGHLGLLAEVVVRSGAVDHVPVLQTELDRSRGRLLMLGATAPVGAADRALGLLSVAVGDHERALEELAAGADLHRRLPAPYLLARSEVDLAHLLRARGDAAAASSAYERAAELSRGLGRPVPVSPIAGLMAAAV